MTGLIFHLIAHTHWDREWYLPRGAFQARLVAVLDEVIERLQHAPAYRSFLLDGQTILLEDYLSARPEREADVRALVKTGRLQVGPWYVQVDELIPSGESLVRNLLFGAADAERLGGRLDVLYSPDAFGHPAVLPSVAREFGMRYAVAWRGLGRVAGQERDRYRWSGPDGKDVLLWQFSPDGYEIAASLPADADRLPAAWAAVRAALVGRAGGQHVPVFVGADHHAARLDLPRLRDVLAELEPASGFRVSRLDEFVRGAAEGAKPAALVGELRGSPGSPWALQGVHATRAPLKRRHALAELALERFAEPLAALARRAGGRDRRPVLDVAWRALVRCQFHDAIAGCASDAVARAVAARLDDVEAIGREIVRAGVHELARHDPDAARDRPGEQRPALVLWNPAARPRGGVVVCDVTFLRRDVPVGPPPASSGGREPRRGQGYRPFALAGADGRAIAVQLLDRRSGLERLDAARHYPQHSEVDRVRVALPAPAVPGLGLAVLVPVAPGTARVPERALVRGGGRTLVNRFVQVTLEPTGALTLHDRRTGERFAGLLRLEDGGDAGDTYTYCPPARDRVVRAAGPIALRRRAAGPLVAALEARVAVRARIDVRLVVMLFADSPVVRCILEVRNAATDHRLRARLPTRLAGVRAVAGAPLRAGARAAAGGEPGDPRAKPVRPAPRPR